MRVTSVSLNLALVTNVLIDKRTPVYVVRYIKFCVKSDLVRLFILFFIISLVKPHSF